MMRRALAALLLTLFLAPSARAETLSRHALSLYARSGLGFYFSDARTAGGLGGGLGLRDTIDDRLVLQVDATWLAMVGNVLDVRLAAGIQRRGTWTPAVLGAVQTRLGSQLSILTSDHPRPIRAPATSVGVVLAPLRFRVGATQVSLFEFGLGIGSDFPGSARTFDLAIAEVAVAF